MRNYAHFELYWFHIRQFSSKSGDFYQLQSTILTHAHLTQWFDRNFVKTTTDKLTEDCYETHRRKKIVKPILSILLKPLKTMQRPLDTLAEADFDQFMKSPRQNGNIVSSMNAKKKLRYEEKYKIFLSQFGFDLRWINSLQRSDLTLGAWYQRNVIRTTSVKNYQT